MIPIAKPLIGKEEKKAVMKVLDSGIIAQGPIVKEFEEKFAQYCGVKLSIATSSGTTALYTALLARGIGKGDEVITSPFTFIASTNSIIYTGAKAVFVDIEEDSFNINPKLIEEKITNKTKAILPVHLYGNPCDMKAIMKIAEDNNLAVIEDACQAHGAEFEGKRVGLFGEGCFSFYPTKNMTTSEGGIITTSDAEVDNNARIIRNHGSEKRYYHDVLGFNFRMTDISAAIGLEQLKKLDNFNARRIENGLYLNKNLNVVGIITPIVKDNVKHVFHQYTIRITEKFGKSRDEVIKALQKNEIGYSIFYPVPVHQQKLYKEMGYKDNLPVSEKVSNEVLSLPVHPSVSEKDLNKITKTLEGLK